MKILMLAPKMVLLEEGVYVGGAINNMICLSRELVAGGHHVTTIAGVFPETASMLNSIPDWCSEFIPVVIPECAPMRYGLRFVRKAAMVIFRMNGSASILHLHSGYASYSVLSSVAKLRRMKFFHSVYCPITSQVDGRNSLLLNRKSTRAILSHTDRFVAISDNVSSSLRKIGISENRVTTIFPVVDYSFFKATSNRSVVCSRLGVRPNDPIILFVGNVSKSKGLDIFLQAMPNVLNAFPNVRCLITTEFKYDRFAPQESFIAGMTEELDLNNHIVRLQAVPNMPELMASVDLLVAPFRDTAGPSDIPLPVIEAMAAGAAIIATCVGGVPEVITNEKTGLSIPPEDDSALAGAITRLLTDKKLCRRIKQNAKREALERFLPDQGAERLLSVYESVLS